MAAIGRSDRTPKRPDLGVSGHSTRSGPERPELVESGPSVLQAGPQETGRTGVPDASMFCIAEARGFLPLVG